MRIFFALELMPSAMLEIATWRDRSFRGLAAGGAAHPVPPGNLHITLAFRGDVAEHKREVLCDRVSQSLDQAPIKTVSLTIDELGYWQRQGILWLGSSRCPLNCNSWQIDSRGWVLGLEVNRTTSFFGLISPCFVVANYRRQRWNHPISACITGTLYFSNHAKVSVALVTTRCNAGRSVPDPDRADIQASQFGTSSEFGVRFLISLTYL